MLNTNIAFNGQLQIKDPKGIQTFESQAVDPKIDVQDLTKLAFDTFIPGEVKKRSAGCVEMANCVVTANKDGDQLVITTPVLNTLEVVRTINKNDLTQDNFKSVFDMFMRYVQDPTKEKVD